MCITIFVIHSIFIFVNEQQPVVVALVALVVVVISVHYCQHTLFILFILTSPTLLLPSSRFITMPKAGRRRRKTRTHLADNDAAQSALTSAEEMKVPKSLVVSGTYQLYIPVQSHGFVHRLSHCTLSPTPHSFVPLCCIINLDPSRTRRVRSSRAGGRPPDHDAPVHSRQFQGGCQESQVDIGCVRKAFGHAHGRVTHSGLVTERGPRQLAIGPDPGGPHHVLPCRAFLVG